MLNVLFPPDFKGLSVRLMKGCTERLQEMKKNFDVE
jgi:hypothetical protein